MTSLCDELPPLNRMEIQKCLSVFSVTCHAFALSRDVSEYDRL